MPFYSVSDELQPHHHISIIFIHASFYSVADIFLETLYSTRFHHQYPCYSFLFFISLFTMSILSHPSSTSSLSPCSPPYQRRMFCRTEKHRMLLISSNTAIPTDQGNHGSYRCDSNTLMTHNSCLSLLCLIVIFTHYHTSTHAVSTHHINSIIHIFTFLPPSPSFLC